MRATSEDTSSEGDKDAKELGFAGELLALRAIMIAAHPGTIPIGVVPVASRLLSSGV